MRPHVHTRTSPRLFQYMLMLFCLLGGTLRAQGPAGTLSGTVKDGQGAPIAGATVQLKSEMGSSSAKTDAQGNYSVTGLAAGRYAVEVTANGFSKLSRAEVAVGTATAQDFKLEKAAQASSSRISEVQLVGLPLNGRSYSQLATLQEGMSDTAVADPSRGIGGSSLTVSGGRPTSNNFLLDGTSIMSTDNSVPTSASGAQLGSEAVLQVIVLSTNVTAENGRGSGGTLNSITKSGSNKFHGTLFEFFRNSKMDARNFFDPGDNPPPFKRNQFGFLLTGPIRHDRTFFMGAYETMRDRLTKTEISTLPTADARLGIIRDCAGNELRRVPVSSKVVPYLNLYPLPNLGCTGPGIARNAAPIYLPTNDTFFTARIDHKISDRDSMFGRYTFDDAASTAPGDLYLFRNAATSRQQYLTLVETHFFNLSTINSFRASLTRPVELVNALYDPMPRDLYFVPGALNFGHIVVPGLNEFGPSWTAPDGHYMTTFQFADDVVLQRGAHGIKMGVDIHRNRWNIFNSNSKSGVWTFNDLENFLQAGPVGTAIQIAEPSSDNHKGFRQTLMGFYAQDAYRATNTLSLTLGLRYEIATVIKESYGRTSFMPDWLHDTVLQRGPMLGSNPSLKNFGPRIGFNWSPARDADLLVGGGFGIYHDQFLEYAVDSQKNSAPYNRRIINRNFDATPYFPNALAVAASVPNNTPFGVAILDYPHISTPTVMRYNLMVQQAFKSGLNLRVGYVGMRGNHLFRGYEANLYPYAVTQADGQLCLPGNAATVRPQDVDPSCPAVPERLAGPLNPAFASLGLNSTDAQAFYNAFQFTAGYNMKNGLSLNGNYTFGKSVDDASQPSSGSTTDYSRQYPHMRTLDRGLSEFDIRHRLSINYFYSLPKSPFGGGFSDHLVGGWRVGGVMSFRTGTAFHPLQNVIRRGYLFSANRPSQLPGFSGELTSGESAGCGDVIQPGEKLGGPDRYFDPCVFVAPSAGHVGDVARGRILGPSVFTMDLSLQKEFKLRGDAKLQFRGEMFNLPNHPNFALPSRGNQIVRSGANGSPNPTAGQIFSTITTSRQLQFALRLSF